MISSRQIKFINSLKSNKYRIKYNCFLAEGDNVINEFIKSNFVIREVFAIDETKINCNDTESLSLKELKKITSFKNPANSLAVIEKKNIDFDIDKILNSKISIFLDDITDPGNFGTIIRTADWFGLSNIYTSKKSCDFYNPKVIQSSMGSASRVVVHKINLFDVLNEIKNKNIKCYGATVSGCSIKKFIADEKFALIFGNESHGINKQILEILDKNISVPSHNSSVESLNVSVAFGIILSEIR